MMRLAQGLLTIISIASSTIVQAQYWQRCGLGTVGPTEVQTLYGDSISDRLLAGGTFRWIKNENDTVDGHGQAAWNGTHWDSLAYRIQDNESGQQQTYHFLRFEGNLYACGGFTLVTQSGNLNRGLARLNEQEERWEELECLNPSSNGMSTLVPKLPGSTLYATGYTGTICGYPEASVFRYDGSAFYEWAPFAQVPVQDANYVGYVFDFLGKTYMTGSYRDPLGSGQLVTFMRYTGSNWEHVPGWDTQSPIKEILVVDSTLYVARCFRSDTGGPGNLIAAFDGENWDTMGGGLAYPPVPMSACARSMVWWHDALYVAGMFIQAGGVPVQKLARWDGHRWCGLPGTMNTNTGSLACIAVFRDSLFMCGGFSTIDGEPIRQVAKWIGGDAVENCSQPVGVDEPVASAMPIRVSPNPANERFTISTAEPVQAFLNDALGRTVWSGRIIERTIIECNDWPSGLYSLWHSSGSAKLLIAH